MKVVIIGAGQTGRGFIAPIMKENNLDITFVDKNSSLINQLSENNNYDVNYFDNLKPKININNYYAYDINSSEAVNAISESDIVTTSVFANQIENLIPIFEEAIKNRSKHEKLKIICIENGVNVKKPLIEANLNAEISEGVIFCTSIKSDKDLSIYSEANIDLPVDSIPFTNKFEIEGMPLVNDFADIIQRKIYTYNFISAIIAYFGDYKGYDEYSAAANDIDIHNFILKIVPVINSLIAKKFNISIEEQNKFSERAIIKFSNKSITDSITRNAQQAERKLKNNERLLIPLKLAINDNLEIDNFCKIISSAIYYGIIHENLDKEIILKRISNDINSVEVDKKVNLYLNMFLEKLPLSEILNNN